MKILLLGDLHTGIGNDDPWVHEYILDTIKKAVDYSKENDIKVWIQTGDWFDCRKAITHATMSFNRTKVIPLLEEAGITCYVTVGNHDLFKRHKIQPNAPREVLSQYECIKVIDSPETVNFDGVSFDLIPWMSDDNKSEILEFIQNSFSEYCVGHWELSGYYFYKGLKSEGYSADFLKKYREVFSGHFHTISDGGNVTYIGTPYTLTAGDENDPRGFWVFDTDSHKKEFIQNDKTYHVRITYPSDENIDVERFKGLSVRLIATVADNGLSKLESALEAVVHKLKVVHNLERSASNETGVIEVKSTIQMVYEYLDEQNLEPDELAAVKRISDELLAEVNSAKS